MQGFMLNMVTAGTTKNDPRGRSNLYSKSPVERAWGHTRKVAVSNRVYKEVHELWLRTVQTVVALASALEPKGSP